MRSTLTNCFLLIAMIIINHGLLNGQSSKEPSVDSININERAHLQKSKPKTKKEEDIDQNLSIIDSEYNYVKLNTFYFELGGASGLYALNYERRFPFSKTPINNGVSLSIGFSAFPNSASLTKFTSLLVPLEFSFTHQNFRSRFDIGVASIIYTDREFSFVSREYESKLSFIQLIVFRYVRSILMNDNFEWGITISPAYYENKFRPWGGIRLGYKF